MDADTRNIIDFYKYWETEAIKADLDKKRNNFSVLCCNIVGDFNLSTIVRNSNAFLGKEVLIYGKRNWDRRGAVGTQNYTDFKRFRAVDDLDSLKEHVRGCHVVGVDNVDGALRIDEYTWPKDKHVVMVFGEEGNGISDDLLDICDDLVYIEQLGSVRSLNVGTASGIAMYSYCQSNVY